MLPTVSGEFRVVNDAELRFTPSGMAVATCRIVANGRKFDKDKNEWVDDKECWLRLTAFKRLAENMAESCIKGRLVNVTGQLQTESYETKEGEKRQSYTVLANTIGMSMAFAPAKPDATERTAAAPATPGGEDPFATPAPAAAATQEDDPPF